MTSFFAGTVLGICLAGIGHCLFYKFFPARYALRSKLNSGLLCAYVIILLTGLLYAPIEHHFFDHEQEVPFNDIIIVKGTTVPQALSLGWMTSNFVDYGGEGGILRHYDSPDLKDISQDLNHSFPPDKNILWLVNVRPAKIVKSFHRLAIQGVSCDGFSYTLIPHDAISDDLDISVDSP